MKRVQSFPYVLGLLIVLLGIAGVVRGYSSFPESKSKLSLAELGAVAKTNSDAEPAADLAGGAAPVPTSDVNIPLPGLFPRIVRPPFGSNRFQAGSEQPGESPICRTHVVFLDSRHPIRGRVRLLGDTDDEPVKFPQPLMLNLIRHGKIQREIPVNEDGEFTLTAISKGTYGVAIRGPETLLALSIYFASIDDLASAGFRPDEIREILDHQAEEPLTLQAMTTAIPDYPRAVALLGERLEVTAPPQPLATNLRLKIPQDVNFLTAEPSTSLKNHPVRLTREGHLFGCVRKPVDQPDGTVSIEPIGGTEVSFLQNNTVVARGVSDVSGKFRVEGLAPGNYSVVGRSVEGISLIGVRVLPWSPVRQVGHLETERPRVELLATTIDEVAAQPPADPGGSLSLDISLMQDFDLLTPEEDTPPAPPAPPAPGAPGAPVAGGGLVGALIGGVIGGVIPDDDDDPVSPDRP